MEGKLIGIPLSSQASRDELPEYEDEVGALGK